MNHEDFNGAVCTECGGRDNQHEPDCRLDPRSSTESWKDAMAQRYAGTGIDDVRPVDPATANLLLEAIESVVTARGRTATDVLAAILPIVRSADANARAHGAAVGRGELAEDEDGAPYPYQVQHARRFFLHREDDVTGTHADGLIAVGIQFADGAVALHWNPPSGARFLAAQGSTAVWTDLETLRATHLHPRSTTELVWVD